ncbi:hypothetical protein ACEUZ9_000676 [Paracoccus litorisediminis]|uniref:Uncharacterized protein n=1 Tax=Paracoccus litorisediminis TaxID=2006130 RepID=A0A844HHU3_9RHOB|nr:hypothetical protein [Paracoccus litorisediminis]MTH59480.1 hypothetical protein [Paracoccus litorisediminis]
MTRFLAAIGPMGQPPTTAWLLFPGDPEQPAVMAPSLTSALPELHRIARGGAIVVEPALAARGAACGLSVGTWHEDARADFTAIALDIAGRASFSRIDDSALILRFCRAAAGFAARPPARGQHGPVLVIDGPGLVLPDRPGKIDGLSVQFNPGEAAVIDALRRSVGLDRVPQPFRLRDDNKLPVSEAELILLTDTLLAVTQA